MAAKKPFWHQPNVIGGLALLSVAFFAPIVLALASAEAYGLVFGELSLIRIDGYGSLGLQHLMGLAGIFWLLSPKIAEFWPWKK